MSVHYLIGDVFERMGELEDGSVDLILTSPPFLALRSYLPANHPDKAKEIGSEATPAEYIDVLLRLSAEWRRLLASHGSLVVELGDTFAGSGGAGGDYAEDGLREGQPTFKQGGLANYSDERGNPDGMRDQTFSGGNTRTGGGPGWPLAKSLTLVPEAYRFALAYGVNPHTGQTSPAGQWRIRNVIRWVRPNPPVGALGDKFRPATSELVVAATSKDRWFDLDAVRGASAGAISHMGGKMIGRRGDTGTDADLDYRPDYVDRPLNPAGAPPLDWWKISPKGYSGVTATTVKQTVDPGEFSGDMSRTTSQDCPTHAGLPDSVPTESDDEPPIDGRQFHTLDNTRPVQGRLLDFAPTDQPFEPLNESDSSDSPDPAYVRAATPRNKALNKTAPALETSPSDTASGRTPDHTERTPPLPLPDEPHPDTPASRTDELDPSSLDRKTADDIVDICDEPSACTCTYFVWDTNFTSHYAVFPSELCVKPIKAMCPKEVCEECGEPRRRLTGFDYTKQPQLATHIKERRLEKGITLSEIDSWFGLNGMASHWQDGEWQPQIPTAEHWPILKDRLGLSADFDELITRWTTATYSGGELKERIKGDFQGSGSAGKQDGGITRHNETVGWSDCGHDNYRPGLVLDPFAGTGTTLAVAHGHGRDAIGIDIDPRNAELARDRVGPLFLDVVASEDAMRLRQ